MNIGCFLLRVRLRGASFPLLPRAFSRTDLKTIAHHGSHEETEATHNKEETEGEDRGP